jgi:hypothetical protein
LFKLNGTYTRSATKLQTLYNRFAFNTFRQAAFHHPSSILFLSEGLMVNILYLCLTIILHYCRMYLKHLYRYNKAYFFLVVLFMMCQLFINFKRGLVVSPFYHFGMYSHVMKPAVKYEAFEVVINGARLQGKNFTPWQWDKINQPLAYFYSVPANNAFFKNEVQRLTAKAGVLLDSSHFILTCSYPRFIDWYKDYLGRLLSVTISQIEINIRYYTYNRQHLQSNQTFHSLSEVCR